MTRPNSVNTTYIYDPLSRLLSALHKKSTSTLDGATYTYDNAGNRLTKQDNRTSATSNYVYDNIYQLKTVTGGSTESYTYDAVGNRLTSPQVTGYTYNSSNQLISHSTVTYTYDNNGNALTRVDASGTTTYNWDFENRLSSVVLPGTGGTVSFVYDPFGRRIKKAKSTTTIYVYDGADILEEVNSTGTTVNARYTMGPGIDQPLAETRGTTSSFYEADGLGTITSLTTSAGAIGNTYTYGSYGKSNASSGTIVNTLRYTARELDSETNLYYYRARYYDQNIGRFISEDPMQFKAGNNFYSYVENNPVNDLDPFGLIHYNKKPPITVPAIGMTDAALQCVERCLQCKTKNYNLDLLVTGGAEQSGHTSNSFHYLGLAVDISFSNSVSTEDLFFCAGKCGFHAGGAEPAKHHWHLQLWPGNGSQPLPYNFNRYDPFKNCDCVQRRQF